MLALAYRSIPTTDAPKIGNWKREDADVDVVFLGLVGLYDPPRPESKLAVQECKRAGISVHMLTGDHPKTAACIARDIGILPAGYVMGQDAMTATQFDHIPDNELDQMRLPRVIARCSPATKVKMVEALLRKRMIVAMTGDGTNDAPSLKRANIGIAMGMGGSDVAKQASDIVLTGMAQPAFVGFSFLSSLVSRSCLRCSHFCLRWFLILSFVDRS